MLTPEHVCGLISRAFLFTIAKLAILTAGLAGLNKNPAVFNGYNPVAKEMSL
jgi:hypothetical protein